MSLTTEQTTHDVYQTFVMENAKGECEGCGLPIRGQRAYRVPRLPGIHCSIACVETALFRQPHCRWCGSDLDKPYLSIESRLCSEDCKANYWAHVLGDHSASLGSGKRLLSWLQHKQPELYRRIIGGSERVAGGHCRNPLCPNGEDGQPASLAHLRAGAKYCCDSCKKQALRGGDPRKVLTGIFDPSQTPVLRGFSRDTLAE